MSNRAAGPSERSPKTLQVMLKSRPRDAWSFVSCRTANGIDFDMPSVQSFLVGRRICDALVSEFKRQRKANRSYAFNAHYDNGVKTDFECVELRLKSLAARTVFEIIKKHVICTECSTMRLHRLDRSQYLTRHTDAYYAGHQTILILLNQKGAGRFKLRRRAYRERPFHATVFRADTVHETTPGAGVRYTLVAWVR